MLPKRPPRQSQVGFLYLPPWRVQGISTAGEQTSVQIPELDVCFDIGSCPRYALTSLYIALSHAHMDHLGGLPYYFSQRHFQKMGTGTVICHAKVAGAIQKMMGTFVELEQQVTPHNILPIEPGEELAIKNNIMLRALEVSHTVPALGYSLIERRSKLRPEFLGLPQTKLRELKEQGTEITQVLQIPLIAYTGDTERCPALYSEEIARAKVVITECTFFEKIHQKRSKVGKHLYVSDLADLLDVWEAEHVVIVHVSRRTNIGVARKRMLEVLGEEKAQRIHFLMDHRANHERFQQQERKVQAMDNS